MTIKCAIHVDRAAAIRAGRDRWGEIVVEVEPAGLTPDEREELATCRERDGVLVVHEAPPVTNWVHGETPKLADADDPVAAVRAWLHARMAARRRREAERERQRETELVAAADPDRWIYRRGGPGQVVADLRNDAEVAELDRLDERLPRFARVRMVSNLVLRPGEWWTVTRPYAPALREEDWQRPEVAAARAEAERRVEAQHREATAREEAAAERLRERLREAVELARARREFLDAFVAQHGDERQRDLWRRGLLPEAELEALLDGQLFADLAELSRLPDTCEACGRPLEWSDAGEVRELRAAEGWQRLRQVEAAVERHGGELRLRRYTAGCDNYACGRELAVIAAEIRRTTGPLPARQAVVLLEVIEPVAGETA